MGNSVLNALLGAAALGVAAKVSSDKKKKDAVNKYVAHRVQNAYSTRWVCPRCGTTNWGDRHFCQRCRNERP